MAKDEFIGIRVSKEFKRFLQGEAKRKGLSLAEYIQTHAEDGFKDTKKHIETLIERAKSDRPEFWKEAEISTFTQQFAHILPVIVTDFLHPLNNNPYIHQMHLVSLMNLIFSSAMSNVDTVHEQIKFMAIRKLLEAGETFAANLNKLKSKDREEQKIIITSIKNIIESMAFYLTSTAFEKDAFIKIKEQLDKTEKILHKDIEAKGRK